MGNVEKAKQKAKEKLRTKMRKVTRKAKKTLRAGSVMISVIALAVITGCASSGEQPARSQNQHNEFDQCFFYVTGTSSNDMPAIEVFTQTQSNAGSETVSPTSTPTQSTSTDLKAQLPAKGSAGSGVLETVLDAFTGGGGGNSESKCANGTCPDGNCCLDGNCSECSE